jgi:protein-disulfide isomerase
MAGWTEFADHFRTIAGGFIVLALLILLLSPAVIVRTPTDIFPNINIPVISVAWTYTGLNPEDIEARLTTRCAEHGGPRPVVRSAPIEAHAVFTASVDVLARFAPMDSTQRLLLPIRPLDHAHGPPDAPYILVEYGDYECPDCGRLYVILRDLQSDVASRLRVVFRHYPLSGSHHHAQQQPKRPRRRGHKGNSGKCTRCFSNGKPHFIQMI